MGLGWASGLGLVNPESQTLNPKLARALLAMWAFPKIRVPLLYSN